MLTKITTYVRNFKTTNRDTTPTKKKSTGVSKQAKGTPAAVPEHKRPVPKRPSSTSVIEVSRAAGEFCFPANFETLCKDVAGSYVRRENRFYRTSDPGNSFGRRDLEQTSLGRWAELYPDIQLTDQLVNQVFQHAIEDQHTDIQRTVGVWDGLIVCRPDVSTRLIHSGGFVTLNSWQTPSYRLSGETEADLGLLPEFLSRLCEHQPDRDVILDWLSWSLQNEAAKMRWGLFFYSRSKGTGKSTFCNLARRLFGEQNARPINGLDKLTGKFNSTVISGKLVTAEEVKINPASSQGNTLKTFITEDTITTETKGRDAQQVGLCSNLILTSNHMPLWIEADDRRLFVVGCDHEGHASGPKAKEFSAFMGEFVAFMEDDRALAKLYNALMQREQAPAFNPNSLNIAEQSNPLMQYIQDAASSVTVEQMEEFIASTGRFAFSQEELLSKSGKDFRMKDTQLRHVMVDMRWNRRNVKWGGVDYARVIWVHPNYEVRKGYVEGPGGYKEKMPSDQFDIEIIN